MLWGVSLMDDEGRRRVVLCSVWNDGGKEKESMSCRIVKVEEDRGK